MELHCYYSATNSTGATQRFSANHKASLEQKKAAVAVAIAFGPITIEVKFYFWLERESMRRATRMCTSTLIFMEKMTYILAREDKGVRELIRHIGPIPILIPLKLFLEGIEFTRIMLLCATRVSWRTNP